MTGVGCRDIRMRRNVKPSIRGISRSSVMTSGLSCVASRSASSPSAALPTTSMSLADAKMSRDVPAVVGRVVDDEDAQRARVALSRDHSLSVPNPRASVDQVFVQVNSSKAVDTFNSDSEWPRRETPRGPGARRTSR